MKILLGLFLLIIFMIPNLAQSKDISALNREIKKFKNTRYYSVTYDKPLDKTLVSFLRMNKGSFALNSPDYFQISAYFVFDGQILDQTNDEFALVFRVNELFSQDRTLYVLADGKSLELTEGINNLRISRIPNPSLTYRGLAYFIEREDLVKLASAQQLEIKFGGRHFLLKPEEQQVLKDIVSISEIK